MFNGYTWQTRILEVRPDRRPPEFENKSQITGAAGYVASTLSTSPPHGPSPVPWSSNTDYSSLFGLERPNSTNGGRNLFVGNVSRFIPPVYIALNTPAAAVPLPMARSEGSFSASRGYSSCRCRLGPRWSFPRIRHRSACKRT
jgi:hypothetical protein